MKSKVISSLCNSTRLKLIVCLSKNEKNVTELINNCGLSQSAVSQHLERLKDARIVSCKKNGKEMIYKLTSKKSAKIAQDLLKFEREVK